MKNKSRFFAKLIASALSVTLLMGVTLLISACNNKESNKTKTNESSNSSSVEPSETAEKTEPITVSTDELPKIQSYITSVVNGSFRAKTNFPDFQSIQELNTEAITGNGLLEKATKAVGLDSIPRQNYEDYLKENLNEGITLPASANYGPAYNPETDAFVAEYEVEKRNFTPMTFWIEAKVFTEGENIIFEAYEFSYEYVNADTGADEVSNPIARIVVDDVTIGFSAPIVRHDLELIDYRPLAKTKYTLKRNAFNGYQMLSKSKSERDEVYKASALGIYGNVKALNGNLANLQGGNLNVRSWASEDSTVYGSLQDKTFIWYVDIMPQTGFVLGGPGATGPVFDYMLGFGFMNKKYIKQN